MFYRNDEHFIYLIQPPFGSNVHLTDELGGQKTKKGWRFPKNVHVYRELYKFFPQLSEDKQFMADAKAESQKEQYWLNLKKHVPTNGESFRNLRPYQNQDVYYLSNKGSTLVFNEPRTGKTPTMIKTMAALGSKRNIVVCPSSLVYNWYREIEKWCPYMDVYPVSGTKTKREKVYSQFNVKDNETKVLVISKDTLKVDKEVLKMKFDVAIVDEAHFLRNYKSSQSKAVFSLQAKTKYALTGTPAVKHGVDVYGLLHFINPKAFPSYWQFAERYWSVDDGQWGKVIGKAKPNRQKELLALMDVNAVQRKRKDVMQWLPKAEHSNLFVKMEGKQEKLYTDMLEVFFAKDEETELDALNKLTQLIRLRQLCLDPRLVGFDVVGAKTQALLEFAENNGEPFIVMTTFSSYFKLIKSDLEKLGKRVAIIDGSISKKQKMENAESFQQGEYDILLCNIIAAGTGFTLDRADTIIFLDKDFNPANNEQAQDRIVPTTQERYHPINIISLVCGGSIDERVNQIIDSKEDLTKIINKPEVFR